MFYYFGRKKRVAHLYPEPTQDTIVEPFAGSAAYSLYGDRWRRRVILHDLDPVICKVWEYLINATRRDIRRLPDKIVYGDSIHYYDNLNQAEKYLIGFHLNPGSPEPKQLATRFNRWSAGKRYLLRNIHKVNHWEIHNRSFALADKSIDATWFIDPPYSDGGQHYVHNSVSYRYLKRWISSLSGQIIVAERESATWLPFKPLGSYAAIKDRVVNEGIYVRETCNA